MLGNLALQWAVLTSIINSIKPLASEAGVPGAEILHVSSVWWMKIAQEIRGFPRVAFSSKREKTTIFQKKKLLSTEAAISHVSLGSVFCF